MTTIHFNDRLSLGSPKVTKDGYLAVRAASARTGIYEYRADEVGAPPDKFAADAIVRVYRDPSEVFSVDSMRSFIGRPITDDHPSVPVTSDNWKKYARGTIMAAGRKVANDGDLLTFDLVLMDKQSIDKVNGGKRELSNGYNCQLDWTPGETEDGQAYDARQVAIVGNHVALVDKGRAGEACAIGDGVRSSPAPCQANLALIADINSPKEARVKLLNLDGRSVNLSDAVAVEETLKLLDAKLTDMAAKLKKAEDEAEEAKGAKKAMDQALEDERAKTAPAVIDKLVSDRADLVATATKLVDGFKPDGLTNDQIRRAVVEAKMGDAAKDMTDAEIPGAFRVVAAAAPTNDSAQPKGVVPKAITQPQVMGDNAAAVQSLRAARYA